MRSPRATGALLITSRAAVAAAPWTMPAYGLFALLYSAHVLFWWNSKRAALKFPLDPNRFSAPRPSRPASGALNRAVLVTGGLGLVGAAAIRTRAPRQADGRRGKNKRC